MHIPEWYLGPEDLMQTVLLLRLPPSGGYEKNITSNDVFSENAIDYPVPNPTAVSPAEFNIVNMIKQAYLPSLVLTHKGSVFVLQVTHEVAEILGVSLKHATTKQAQPIGVPERTHATIETSLEMETGDYRKQW